MPPFQALLEQYAALALERQWALDDFLGDHEWFLDLEDGTITFNQQHQFSVQVLGTVSDYTNTWLWAWANTQSPTPDHLLHASKQLIQYGHTHHIAELTQAKLDLDHFDGHQIAMIASGLCEADCYYCGPYDGGAVFVLIDAPMIRVRSEPSSSRMVTVFQHLISLFPLNHRRAFTAYCSQKRYVCQEEGSIVVAQHASGYLLQACFDTNDRLLDLKTSTHHE